MRRYEIKRRESGRFYLFSLFGTGRCLHEQEWDLAVSVSESKVMLEELFKKFRLEELPEEDREALLKSIDDLIPIGAGSIKPPQTGQIVLPGQHESFVPLTVKLSSF